MLMFGKVLLTHVLGAAQVGRDVAGGRVLCEPANLAKPGPYHSLCAWPCTSWSLGFLICEMGTLVISEVTHCFVCLDSDFSGHLSLG